MPNHVVTIIRADDRKILSEVLKKANQLKTENKWEVSFDFNVFVPMPKHKEGVFFAKGSLEDNERTIYGDNNWYDWSIKNWGTKWNAYATREENLREQYETDDIQWRSLIKFETAWSHPLPVIKAMSKEYPNTEFWIQYADEDLGYNLGEYKIKDGKVLEETKFKNQRDKDTFARAVWHTAG